MLVITVNVKRQQPTVASNDGVGCCVDLSISSDDVFSRHYIFLGVCGS